MLRRTKKKTKIQMQEFENRCRNGDSWRFHFAGSDSSPEILGSDFKLVIGCTGNYAFEKISYIKKQAPTIGERRFF